jgi:hypothetical protein
MYEYLTYRVADFRPIAFTCPRDFPRPGLSFFSWAAARYKRASCNPMYTPSSGRLLGAIECSRPRSFLSCTGGASRKSGVTRPTSLTGSSPHAKVCLNQSTSQTSTASGLVPIRGGEQYPFRCPNRSQSRDGHGARESGSPKDRDCEHPAQAGSEILPFLYPPYFDTRIERREVRGSYIKQVSQALRRPGRSGCYQAKSLESHRPLHTSPVREFGLCTFSR